MTKGIVGEFSEGRGKWIFHIGAALLALLVLLAYHGAGSIGFIWDDDLHVTHNLLLRSTDGLWRIWAEPRAFPQYLPVTLTTFWLQYRAHGAEPFWYHAVNLALHAGNAVLLWALLRRLSVPGAWLAAAIFAVHPAHVESVAWAAERKNVLSALFYFASALAYLNWRGRRGAALWWLSLGLFILSFLAKSVTATLPAALLLIVWWKEGRIVKKDWKALSPHLALGVAFGLFAAQTEHSFAGASTIDWGINWFERLLNAGRIAWFYPLDLLWPVDRAFFRPMWRVSMHDPASYLWPAVLFLALWLLWRYRGKIGRGPLVGALFYLGSIFPVLGFLNVYPMKFSWVADHFQYIASIGPICLVVALTMRAIELLPSPAARDWGRIAATVALLAPITALSIARVPVYASEETLWKDTIAKNPASTISYRNLQTYLSNRAGRNEEAIWWGRKAVELGVEDDGILVNLGEIYANTGRISDAEASYRAALARNPANPKAAFRLGLIFKGRGNTAEAAAWFGKAAEGNPRDPGAAYNLGIALAELGDITGARRYLNRALEIEPGYADARRALLRLGR